MRELLRFQDETKEQAINMQKDIDVLYLGHYLQLSFEPSEAHPSGQELIYRFSDIEDKFESMKELFQFLSANIFFHDSPSSPQLKSFNLVINNKLHINDLMNQLQEDVNSINNLYKNYRDSHLFEYFAGFCRDYEVNAKSDWFLNELEGGLTVSEIIINFVEIVQESEVFDGVDDFVEEKLLSYFKADTPNWLIDMIDREDFKKSILEEYECISIENGYIFIER